MKAIVGFTIGAAVGAAAGWIGSKVYHAAKYDKILQEEIEKYKAQLAEEAAKKAEEEKKAQEEAEWAETEKRANEIINNYRTAFADDEEEESTVGEAFDYDSLTYEGAHGLCKDYNAEIKRSLAGTSWENEQLNVTEDEDEDGKTVYFIETSADDDISYSADELCLVETEIIDEDEVENCKRDNSAYIENLEWYRNNGYLVGELKDGTEYTVNYLEARLYLGDYAEDFFNYFSGSSSGYEVNIYNKYNNTIYNIELIEDSYYPNED